MNREFHWNHLAHTTDYRLSYQDHLIQSKYHFCWSKWKGHKYRITTIENLLFVPDFTDKEKMSYSIWWTSNKSVFHPINVPHFEPSTGLEIQSTLLILHSEDRQFQFTSIFLVLVAWQCPHHISWRVSLVKLFFLQLTNPLTFKM